MEGRSLLERGGAAPTSEPTMRTVFFLKRILSGKWEELRAVMTHGEGKRGRSLGNVCGRREAGEKTRHGRAKPLV